jgi:hypothetical protein
MTEFRGFGDKQFDDGIVLGMEIWVEMMENLKDFP